MVLAGALLAGAWAERQGIGIALEAAADEGLIAVAPDLRGAPGAGRVALVRLLSLVPVAVALVLAWQPLYDVTYRELILPDDLVDAAADPRDPVGALAAGRDRGHVAAERHGRGGGRAAPGPGAAVRSGRVGAGLGGPRPAPAPRASGRPSSGVAVLVLLAGPSLMAAAIGWQRVRDLVGAGQPPVLVLAAVLVWVAIWLGGLVLTAVGAAFRSAAMTMEAVRRP